MTKRSNRWHSELVKAVLTDPVAHAEYEAFKLQLELPAVARLEAGGGKGRHSPSLHTLVRYADALGYRLEIKLVPESRSK